jgi:uncharacterized protein
MQAEGQPQALITGAELLESQRDEIRRIAALHGVSNIRVFGSVARRQDSSGSDIDLLVDLEHGRSLLDLIAVKQDLEDLLGREIDLITERSVSPYLRESVLASAVRL